MVAPILPTKEMGEPEIRLRRGLFGHLVVQIRYPVVQLSSLHSPEDKWEKIRMGLWRDVKVGNLKDTFAALNRLDCSIK